jgi:hypothetical protein
MREARDLIAALPDAKPQAPAGRTPIGDEALTAVRQSRPQAAVPETAVPETAEAPAPAPVPEVVAGPPQDPEPEPVPERPGGLLRAMLLRACQDAVQYYAPVDGECGACRDGEVCDWHWATQMRFAEFECLRDQLLAARSDEHAAAVVKASGVDLGVIGGWGSPFALDMTEGGAL